MGTCDNPKNVVLNGARSGDGPRSISFDLEDHSSLFWLRNSAVGT